MMDLLTKQGKPKLVRACTYPLTGLACVKRVYSDLASFEITPSGVKLMSIIDGLSKASLEQLLGFELL
ncbi:MAG: hypothetical protein RLZZ502_1677, partial [Pseudomonadota bacterium]|jgi:3-oxoadipate CoA-transferase beta subunit